MYWHCTVPLNNAQMGLGDLGELQSRGTNGETILAYCPLYHLPKGTLSLMAQDDVTVDWLRRIALSI